LFDRILRTERESEFTPQTLMKIRNSTIPSESLELKTNYSLPYDGTIPWSSSFVRSNFEATSIDFKLIISWFQQLRILNIFNPLIVDIKAPQEIYLTAWIATEGELAQFYDQVQKGKQELSSSVSQNCARLLEIIEAVKVKDGLLEANSGNSLKISENLRIRNSLINPYNPNLFLIGEKGKSRYLITSPAKQIERMFVLAEKDASMIAFRSILTKFYVILKKKWKTPYVWISPLRALCCRSIMISDERFDQKLTQLYEAKPEAIEFSKAATGIFRTRVRIFEKPFKLYNNPFRMIRLVENI